MSDAQGSEQYRSKLSTASTILGLTLFGALCISIFVRHYMVARSGRAWPWSSRRDPDRSVERRFSEDEPRTIAIGGRAKNLRIPLMWDAYIQTDGLLKVDKTKEKTTKSPERPLESELASLQPLSIQMLTPHTAGPFTPGMVLRSPGPVAPLPHRATPSTPQHLPRAVRAALYPHGALPTPQFQRRASPRDSTPATPPLHTDIPTSFSSASTPTRVIPQESLARNTSELAPNPPSTSVLAPHPLQLTFLITLPDPSFPTHFPPSSQTPPPIASFLPPTFGILTPPRTFLLPSLAVPAESLTSWWDLPDELSSVEGDRAPGWEFRLREIQVARERISRGNDVAFALRLNGRGIGRRM